MSGHIFLSPYALSRIDIVSGILGTLAAVHLSLDDRWQMITMHEKFNFQVALYKNLTP
jgi:hypothetical protein